MMDIEEILFCQLVPMHAILFFMLQISCVLLLMDEVFSLRGLFHVCYSLCMLLEGAACDLFVTKSLSCNLLFQKCRGY